MRLTSLFLPLFPLLATGWLSLKLEPVAPLSAAQPIATAPSHEEPRLANEITTNEITTMRRAAESPTHAGAAVATQSASVGEVLTATELPLLPIKALLEEGATSERYAEWYVGTSTELLCLNLLRLTALRRWDQKTCPCVNSEILLKRTKTHERDPLLEGAR